MNHLWNLSWQSNQERKSQFHKQGGNKKWKRTEWHGPHSTPNLKDETKEGGLAPPLPWPPQFPAGASSRKWGPFREAPSLIPSEAWLLHNGLFYDSLWLLISHYELRFWQEPRFWGREKECGQKRLKSWQRAVFCCYWNHPGRKGEPESPIGSGVTLIQSPHEKGDVCFNSVLLKIGNARETIADLNSCWSDKPEEQYRPGKSDMVFPFPQLFFFF